ncbi:hypothetical protein [Kineosporia sp. A_224]|uniref:hypothetical protein n=1 Tax=Kineosporia sp. A_224 TaxID=1962180 RepID=UPI001179B56B|nr:hypothetical protein [Kineosporia sp. A_224]
MSDQTHPPDLIDQVSSGTVTHRTTAAATEALGRLLRAAGVHDALTVDPATGVFAKYVMERRAGRRGFDERRWLVTGHVDRDDTGALVVRKLAIESWPGDPVEPIDARTLRSISTQSLVAEIGRRLASVDGLQRGAYSTATGKPSSWEGPPPIRKAMRGRAPGRDAYLRDLARARTSLSGPGILRQLGELFPDEDENPTPENTIKGHLTEARRAGYLALVSQRDRGKRSGRPLGDA